MRRHGFLKAYFLLFIIVGCGQNNEQQNKLEADEWQPSLGGGVNFSETKSFRTCVNQVELEQSPLALNRLYKETRVTSKKDLHKTLDVSASVSAKGLWGSASASASYFNDIEIHDQGFYWLVDANYAVTSEKIKTNGNFDLSNSAKKILENEGIDAFYQACGTHFYSGRQVGGRYTLIYEFNSKEDKVVERLKARANYSGFGVKAKGAFSRLLDLAEQSSILRVHSRIVGGGESINNFVKDPDKLEDELQKLRTDLLTHRRGEVLKWYITSYDIFEDVLRKKREASLSDISDEFRIDALEFYFNLYSDNNKVIATLNNKIYTPHSEEPLYIYSQEDVVKIKFIINQYHQQNLIIKDRAIKCLRGSGECSLVDLTPLTSSVPLPQKDLTNLGNWQIYPIVLDHDTSVSRINFIGQPLGDFETRIFGTNNRFYSNGNNAFAVINLGDRNETFTVGNLNMILDPSSGRNRPALCVGEYQKICNLRIVENPQNKMEDGYPAAKMVLSIFDQYGFITAQATYFIQ